MSMSRENLVLSGAVVTGVILLFIAGFLRRDLLVEDGLVETLSAAGFAAALLLAAYVAYRKWALLTLGERIALVGAGLVSSIAFLSEISFGARIFGIQMPRMRGGGEFDGGHDIVMVLFRRLEDAGAAGKLAAAAGGALLAASVAAILWVFRRKAQAVAAHILSGGFEFRLAAAVGMLASAVVLDLMHSAKASTLEEVLEFYASVMLILAVSKLLRQPDVRAVLPGNDLGLADVTGSRKPI
jgi:hypothetical protein